MPVSLLSFNARRQEAVVALDWVTTQETNSSHFEIQRSTDGLDWRSIGSVGAALESSSNKNYRFLDLDPVSGENLYRLKMIDMDGSFTYSRITSVRFDAGKTEISIFPNPVTERLFLQVRDAQAVRRIAIYNLSGTIVSSFDAYPNGGIPLQNLPAGLYLLQVSTSDGLQEQLKFVKN